jgi:O-antigen ligase
MAGYLFLRMNYVKKYNIKDVLISLLLIFAAIIAQGRTSIIAVLVSLMVFLLIQRKFRIIIYSITLPLIIIAYLAIYYPLLLNEYFNVFLGAFSLFVNPNNDVTGTALWRATVNLAALSQAIQTIWFGQGYGGYYYFNIPTFSAADSATIPHNLYIIILLKAGLIGVVLFLVFLFSLLVELFKSGKRNKLDPRYCLFISIFFIIVLSQLPYGLGYTYINTIGLYSGFAFLLMYLQNEPFPLIAVSKNSLTITQNEKDVLS